MCFRPSPAPPSPHYYQLMKLPYSSPNFGLIKFQASNFFGLGLDLYPDPDSDFRMLDPDPDSDF